VTLPRSVNEREKDESRENRRSCVRRWPREPAGGDTLSPQRCEAGLLVMMVARESLVEPLIGHHDE
jgi:hypothetical protein